jgi:uncharacterized protein YecE (DUF72 family)
MVRIGCSGWNYESWKGRLYPEKEPRRRWLEIYAESFGTVEVNATFYRLASRPAVEAWVDETPDGFLFAVKASRFLTHVKRLKDISQGIDRFYAPLEPLRDAGRLGPVLWQLPEDFHRDDERLDGWLNLLPEGRHTVEFRHQSWFARPVMEALRSHDVALTVGDHPSRPFQSHEATAGWRYVRFHYGRGRDGHYTRTQLLTWSRRIAQWRRSGEVYVYFNNDWNGFAPANARELAEHFG